jgi:hypothetical protein
MNALVNAPHTWLNKINGLPTRTTPEFEAGKRVHRIVQDSVSGKTPHPLLSNLPTFSKVENCDFDKTMEVTHKINKHYHFHGYADLIDDTRKDFGDIKSGAPWSVQKIMSHPQFWLYSWALGYSDFWLINLPKETETWNKNNITVIKAKFNDKHYDRAQEFIDRSIDVIENIKDYIAKEDFEKSRYFCWYIDCPFCQKA